VDEQDVQAQISALGMAHGAVHHNLPPAELVARSLARHEGLLAANGALVVLTGARTGRSPRDRYIVDDDAAASVDWNAVNRPCTPEYFDRLLRKALAHLREHEVYVFDGFVGAERVYRMPVRIVAENAWHALFAHTLLVRPQPADLDGFEPRFTVIDCGNMRPDPMGDEMDGAFIGISLSRRIILIMGTNYGGEIKKSLFSVMNYMLPERRVLPMHCSATAGSAGDVALYFGLSGTGKTTLSADPRRHLIGDDEHGWSDHGVFNFEGGCYAKVIRLSAEAEPQIFQAIRFGSLLENVVVDPFDRAIAWDDDSITENTRATYPIDYIPGAVTSGVGRQPSNIFFLTCDAFGVLPPIAELTPDMALYHFLAGFTAKIAGTEAGVDEPQPTFSTCFGAPFMPRDPVVYATMLRERLRAGRTRCWLVNTGWSGGPYGVGKRMPIALTRALLSAALEGHLRMGASNPHPVFRVLVPDGCPGVPAELLDPRQTWADGEAYDEQALRLARMFAGEHEKYADRVPDLEAAAPVTA